MRYGFINFSIALLNNFYGTTFIKFTSTESFILVGIVVLLAAVTNIKFGGWFTLSYLLVPIVLEYVFVMIGVSSIIGMYVQQIILFIVIYMLLKIHILKKGKYKNKKRDSIIYR